MAVPGEKAAPQGPTETELFATDAYRRSFDSAVLEVDRDQGRVALARTALYPGGCGQPHDLGTLRWSGGAAPVTKVKRDGGRIWLCSTRRSRPARPPRCTASWTGTAGTYR